MKAPVPISSLPPGAERRSGQRWGLITFAWYKRVDDAAAADEEGVARSCDVSAAGLGMVTARHLEVGARLFIELMTNAGNVSLIGRVRNLRPAPGGCFRLGILVEALPPSDRHSWERLCAGLGPG